MNQIKAAITIAVAIWLPGIVVAQEPAASYPTKPVRVIVPVSPGGGLDVLARLFAQQLSSNLQRTFLVDNRPGASNTIGTAVVARSAPDGYTLLALTPNHCIQPAVSASLPYDGIRDFEPISLVTKTPFLLLVHPSLPVRSLKELIALAKARPGELNAGGSGRTSLTDLSTMWLADLARIKVAVIPYKGVGSMLIDLIGGQLQMSFTNGVAAIPYVRQGKLRALGISTASRSSSMPDIPTVAEQGLPGFEFSSWHGWAAPAGTPPAIVNKLSVELSKSVKSPDIRKKLLGDGAEPVGSTPEEFRTVIHAELARWRKLVADLKIPVQ